MKYLALVIPFMLSGCIYQSVNANDIETAIQACGGLEKVQEIEASFNGGEVARCTNRSTVFLDERVWAKK